MGRVHGHDLLKHKNSTAQPIPKGINPIAAKGVKSKKGKKAQQQKQQHDAEMLQQQKLFLQQQQHQPKMKHPPTLNGKINPQGYPPSSLPAHMGAVPTPSGKATKVVTAKEKKKTTSKNINEPPTFADAAKSSQEKIKKMTADSFKFLGQMATDCQRNGKRSVDGRPPS